MADLKTEFETATQEVQKLPKKPDDQTLLKLYAFYKQATVGNVSGPKPGFTDFVGRAKYDAWSKMKGMPTEKAMQEYVNLVTRLKG
jgi:diazepam-binding inhibitor (GABA receptor modulating acyl-CoA-binding protein)